MLDIEKQFFDNNDSTHDNERLDVIVDDFNNVLEKLKSCKKSVSIFGSSRTKVDSTFYNLACNLSEKLSSYEYTIITGGSGGIMEAANKGADDSIGFRIKLTNEQRTNKYVKTPVEFHYFFTRKVSFIKYSDALVYFPGGFGTMDELFEALCLIQTKKISPKPMVLFGKEFFSHLESFFHILVVEKYISQEDLNLFLITDSIEEALNHIETNLN